MSECDADYLYKQFLAKDFSAIQQFFDSEDITDEKKRTALLWQPEGEDSGPPSILHMISRWEKTYKTQSCMNCYKYLHLKNQSHCSVCYEKKAHHSKNEFVPFLCFKGLMYMFSLSSNTILKHSHTLTFKNAYHLLRLFKLS